MELFEAASMIGGGIQTALKNKKGFLVGRNGTIEMETVLTRYFQNTFYQQNLLTLERNAGVFPGTARSAQAWVAETVDAIRACDLLVAGWYAPIAAAEIDFLKRIGKNETMFMPLRALEPYYVPYDFQWTRHFLWRKVAVVSSFADLAIQQVKKAKEIWGDRAGSLLPEAEYIPIQTGYAPVLAQGRAGWPEGITTWQEAVDSVVSRVLASEAEIVLIGCGGLSMLIGRKLKEAGKVCVIMGGAIQVLFGIKGNRWKDHSVISKFWNDSWVYPPLEMTPAGSAQIEGGCYWGGGGEVRG
jgi:hypothetical protein